MCVGRDLRCRGLACADRPNRLVSDQNFCELFPSESGCATLAMIENYGLGLAGIAMVESLADTHDRRESHLERSGGLLAHRFISFAEILAAFAMSDDYVRAAYAANHFTRHFTGVRAFLRPEHILRTDSDSRAFSAFDSRRQIRKRRANDDLAMGGAYHQWQKFLEEAGGLGGGFVHLPITRHYWFSHTIAGKKLVPFAM